MLVNMVEVWIDIAAVMRIVSPVAKMVRVAVMMVLLGLIREVLDFLVGNGRIVILVLSVDVRSQV
jgi:hypothetical protein